MRKRLARLLRRWADWLDPRQRSTLRENPFLPHVVSVDGVPQLITETTRDAARTFLRFKREQSGSEVVWTLNGVRQDWWPR